MGSLSPATYLSVGIGVSVASLLVPGMGLFVLVGVAFVLVGAIRLGRRDAAVPASSAPHTYRTVAHHPPHARACTVCGTANNPRAHFCGRCGNRL